MFAKLTAIVILISTCGGTPLRPGARVRQQSPFSGYNYNYPGQQTIASSTPVPAFEEATTGAIPANPRFYYQFQPRRPPYPFQPINTFGVRTTSLQSAQPLGAQTYNYDVPQIQLQQINTEAGQTSNNFQQTQPTSQFGSGIQEFQPAVSNGNEFEQYQPPAVESTATNPQQLQPTAQANTTSLQQSPTPTQPNGTSFQQTSDSSSVKSRTVVPISLNFQQASNFGSQKSHQVPINFNFQQTSDFGGQKTLQGPVNLNYQHLQTPGYTFHRVQPESFKQYHLTPTATPSPVIPTTPVATRPFQTAHAAPSGNLGVYYSSAPDVSHMTFMGPAGVLYSY